MKWICAAHIAVCFRLFQCCQNQHPAVCKVSAGQHLVSIIKCYKDMKTANTACKNGVPLLKCEG